MNNQNNQYAIMFRDYPDVLHVRDIQKILCISKHQVYRLIVSGAIRGIKVGKSYKIPKISIIDYLMGNATE